MPTDDYAIDVQDLTTHYGERKILDRVAFQARQGEIMVIMGGSGSNRGTIAGAILLWGFFSTTRFLEGYISLSPSASSALRMVIIGIILVGLMMFRPQGLFGRKEELAIGK